MKFATKPHNSTHLTLGMLLHCLWKIKIKIFCKYSSDMENANKLHFYRFYNFVAHPQILIFWLSKIASFSHIDWK